MSLKEEVLNTFRQYRNFKGSEIAEQLRLQADSAPYCPVCKKHVPTLNLALHASQYEDPEHAVLMVHGS